MPELPDPRSVSPESLHLWRLLAVRAVVDFEMSQADAAVDIAESLGFTIGALEAGVNLIHTGCLLGQLSEADEIGQQLLGIVPAPLWEAVVASNLATVKYELDDLAASEELSARALQSAGSVGAVAQVVSARLMLAYAMSARGDWDGATRQLLAASKEADATGGRHGQVLSVQAALIDLALAKGDGQEAARLTEVSLTDLDRAERTMRVPLLRVMGSALVELDPARSRSMFIEARDLARSMDMRLEEARTLLALSESSGDDRDGLLAQAREIFNACGSKRGLAEMAEPRLSAGVQG